jgi:hypothetical protein
MMITIQAYKKYKRKTQMKHSKAARKSFEGAFKWKLIGGALLCESLSK